MFNNDILEQWLDQKSQEILNKIQREHITTEDMIILLLKAQVNHFHHMDSEFRDEFNNLLYEVRQDRGDNIDFSKNFTNITQ